MFDCPARMNTLTGLLPACAARTGSVPVTAIPAGKTTKPVIRFVVAVTGPSSRIGHRNAGRQGADGANVAEAKAQERRANASSSSPVEGSYLYRFPASIAAISALSSATFFGCLAARLVVSPMSDSRS